MSGRFAAVPAARPVLERLLATDPAAIARAGAVLRESRHRTTARVEAGDLGAVLLKVHHPRGLLDALADALRGSRARREWDVARFLHGAGVPVPEPLAVGEGGGLPPRGSFYVARFVEGAASLSDRARSADRAALLSRVGAVVRAMHDVGVDHRDLTALNVLVGPDEEVRLVDLHRARAGRPVGEGRRWRSLGPLLESVGASDGDVSALLDGYAPDRSGASRARALASLAAAKERMDRHRARRRARHATKESGHFTRLSPPLTGWRRRELPTERIDRALEEHDALLREPGPRLAKRSARGAVTCHGDLVVKELTRTGFARVREALIPWRRAAGYRNAHALLVRGFATARPLAFVRSGARAFTLYEDLSALPRLDHLARERFRDRGPGAAALLEGTARWVARLHAAGVYHGDLKGVNVRVGTEAGDGAFRLIDTDRCRFSPRPVGFRRRMKNLAQLAASIPRSVTRTDRLRWFRAYAEGTPLAARGRAVARAVARRLARKDVVVDRPIE